MKIEDVVTPGTVKSTETSHKTVWNQEFKLSWLHVAGIGILSALTGHIRFWNEGLHSGFGSFIISTVLLAVANLLISCCLSEMMSALPFSGGSFTLVRCIVGFYYGFVMGCCQLFMFLGLSAILTYELTKSLVITWSLSSSIHPVLIICVYTIVSLVCLLPSKYFFILSNACLVFSVLVIMVCVFSSLNRSNLNSHGIYHHDDMSPYNGQWFVGGGRYFMEYSVYANWFYLGSDSLSFRCADIKNAKADTPKLFILTSLILSVSSITLVIVCSSLYPGIQSQSTAQYPLFAGYSLAFKANLKSFQLIVVWIQMASIYGFIVGFGCVGQAMSKSNLLASILSKSAEKRRSTPTFAILFGTTLSFLLAMLMWIIPITKFIEISVIIAYVFTSILTAAAYITMNRKYKNLSKGFISPFGYSGASLAIVLLFVFFVGAVGFRSTYSESLAVLVTYIGLMTVYYFTYALKRQIFNDEEMKLTFSSLVVKFNMRAMNNARKGTIAPISSSHVKSANATFSKVDTRHRATSPVKWANITKDQQQVGGKSTETSTANSSETQPVKQFEEMSLGAKASAFLLQYQNLTQNNDANTSNSGGINTRSSPEVTSDPLVALLKLLQPAPNVTVDVEHRKNSNVATAAPSGIAPIPETSEASSKNHSQILNDGI